MKMLGGAKYIFQNLGWDFVMKIQKKNIFFNENTEKDIFEI
jgi:hypothetical protein